MENLGFEEDIQMTHQDEDYEDYRTLDTSKIGQTSFTEPTSTEVKSTLQLRQKVKLDKNNA